MSVQEMQLQNQIEQEAAPVVIDGYLIDQETGEVLGHVEVKSQFQVTDRKSAEWVLEKILNAESDVLAVEETPTVIAARAILSNAEKIKKERQARADWLRTRFEPELGHWAKQALEETGGKSKTIKTLFGSISLRTVKGGVRVLDKEFALELAKKEYPDAVKVSEEFQISKLTDEQKREIEVGLAGTIWPSDDTYRRAFDLKPETEAITIKTGVE